MKTVTSELGNHIVQDVTTLATCCLLERVDGTQLGFTSHDQDLPFDGVTYKAATAVDPTAIEHSSDLSVNNLQLTGLIDSDDITDADIRARRYDGAEIWLFLLDWEHPEYGPLKTIRGWLGEIKMSGSAYVAELRGLTQALQNNLLELYTPECPATFGDSRCGFDVAAITQAGEVAAIVEARRTFTTTGLTIATATEFVSGTLTFTSGLNNGLRFEVKEASVAGQLTFYLKAPFTVAVEDTFTLAPGCAKSREACIAYDNILNFRGFPDLIGQDALMEYPDATF